MFGRGGKEAAQTVRRGGTLSVIGPDVVITGDVSTADELRVDGRIEGNVRCGALDQGGDGIIAGDIEAEEARIAGTVSGKVSVRSLALEAGARVSGDVSYESLTIAAGARVDGRLAHRGGEVPSEAQPQSGRRGRSAKSEPGSGVAELFPEAAE